jgi:hypothetical protein
MIANKNFAPLNKAHAKNFEMARQAMSNGVTPVIVDNTNIKANEPKNYVEAALNMGFADSNIQFVDVGTGGLSAEELAERNTHGVPLDKIKAMIQSHKSVGPLSLEKVIKAKPMYKNKPKMFASVVLDDKSRLKLVDFVKQYLPKDWDIIGQWGVIAHHMTINFGKGLPEDLKDDLGKTVQLKVVSIGLSDMALAVGVEGYPAFENDGITPKRKPHVTIAVNRPSGGKPVMSNDIQKWDKVEGGPNLSGKVTEEKLA